ncbi:MAG TPA: PqqD family protein [Candidatus Polarisedimenticolia bacterium]|nr:PqqD family protein [Candidatus Polarisedimenticolia bacterium]
MDQPKRAQGRWQDESRPKRADSVVAQRASDAVVLLHLESGRYFSLEGTGDRIWQLCDGVRTLEEIIRAVSDEFGAEPATVRADMLELLGDLEAEGLVDDAR